MVVAVVRVLCWNMEVITQDYFNGSSDEKENTEPPFKKCRQDDNVKKFRNYLEYVDRLETRKATVSLCSLLNHDSVACQCFEKFKIEEPPNMPFNLAGQNDLVINDDIHSLPVPTIFITGNKTDSFYTKSVIKCKKDVPLTTARKDNEEAKRRRAIKTKLFMDLGIIRTNDGIDDKEKNRDDTIKRKVKETIVTTYCELCAQNFSSAKMLLLHNSKVHETSALECHMCLKRFGTTSLFNKHMKTHYGPTALYHVQCEMCDRKFKDKESLTTHMKVTHWNEDQTK